MFNTFEEIEHKYTNRFYIYNFKQPSAFIKYLKFSIFYWGLQLLNKILSKTEKIISNFLIFKARIKEKLLPADNELDYF